VNILVRYRLEGRSAKEISASVEAGVRGGQLAPGDQLPAVRELAAQLGVSPTTVAAAYADLRRRGLTAGAGRAGTRIRGAPPVSSRVYLSAPAGTRDLITGGPDPDLLPLLPAWPARRPARMYAEAPVAPRLRYSSQSSARSCFVRLFLEFMVTFLSSRTLNGWSLLRVARPWIESYARETVA